MTVHTQNVMDAHIADGETLEFPFTFRILLEKDLAVFLDATHQSSGYTISLDPDGTGGIVTFVGKPADGVIVTLLRAMAITQETDYVDYDSFPAESHERALDKLTLLVQQNTAILAKNAIQIPLVELLEGINVITPPKETRANSFLAFDSLGNVVTTAGEPPDGPSVRTVEIQDGSGGEDSRDVMAVDNVSGGVEHPKIGFKNINKPNGAVQINAFGKIPPELIDISGFRLLGPYRGDDLCPKYGDEGSEVQDDVVHEGVPVDHLGNPVVHTHTATAAEAQGDPCVEPDYRNPSQRFDATFSSGDIFIITFVDGETTGSINLLTTVGQSIPAPVVVAAQDGILFTEEIRDPDTDVVIAYEGWYHIPDMVNPNVATNISYTDTGNEYVLGANVQAALDATDNAFVANEAHFLTNRDTFRSAFNADVDPAIMEASGLYSGVDLVDPLSKFHILSIYAEPGESGFMGVSSFDNKIYSSTFKAGVFSDWVGYVQEPVFEAAMADMQSQIDSLLAEVELLKSGA